jgi:hypothetical protein
MEAWVVANGQHQLLDMIWNWQLDCGSLHRIESTLSLDWKFTLELWPLIEVFYFITNVS